MQGSRDPHRDLEVNMPLQAIQNKHRRCVLLLSRRNADGGRENETTYVFVGNGGECTGSGDFNGEQYHQQEARKDHKRRRHSQGTTTTLFVASVWTMYILRTPVDDSGPKQTRAFPPCLFGNRVLFQSCLEGYLVRVQVMS